MLKIISVLPYNPNTPKKAFIIHVFLILHCIIKKWFFEELVVILFVSNIFFNLKSDF